MKRPTSKSYAGRQVDIEVLRHVEEMLRKQRVHPDLNTTPRIVSGIEKAVQRYAKLFLTVAGSVRLDRGLGSILLTEIKAGRVSNTAVLDSLYSRANSAALQAIMRDDSQAVFGDIPDDERIVNTTLVDMELDYRNATVRIHVMITTAAGGTFTFVIPVASGISR